LKNDVTQGKPNNTIRGGFPRQGKCESLSWDEVNKVVGLGPRVTRIVSRITLRLPAIDLKGNTRKTAVGGSGTVQSKKANAKKEKKTQRDQCGNVECAVGQVGNSPPQVGCPTRTGHRGGDAATIKRTGKGKKKNLVVSASGKWQAKLLQQQHGGAAASRTVN